MSWTHEDTGTQSANSRAILAVTISAAVRSSCASAIRTSSYFISIAFSRGCSGGTLFIRRMLTNVMEVTASITPLAKKTARFSPGNCFASFAFDPVLMSVYVYSAVASQCNRTRTSFAGKIASDPSVAGESWADCVGGTVTAGCFLQMLGEDRVCTSRVRQNHWLPHISIDHRSLFFCTEVLRRVTTARSVARTAASASHGTAKGGGLNRCENVSVRLLTRSAHSFPSSAAPTSSNVLVSRSDALCGNSVAEQALSAIAASGRRSNT
jgi:hypothetical protein